MTPTYFDKAAQKELKIEEKKLKIAYNEFTAIFKRVNYLRAVLGLPFDETILGDQDVVNLILLAGKKFKSKTLSARVMECFALYKKPMTPDEITNELILLYPDRSRRSLKSHIAAELWIHTRRGNLVKSGARRKTQWALPAIKQGSISKNKP